MKQILSAVFLMGMTIGILNAEEIVRDYDNNSYHVVRIGSQSWLKENLKSLHYSDGISIPDVVSFNNDESLATVYGRLYTWPAAMKGSNTPMTQGVCPCGWHVPSDPEWTTMEEYLGGAAVAGGKLKEAGTAHWKTPNTGADNSSGFSALGAGEWDTTVFHQLTEQAVFWTSTEISAEDAREQYLSFDNAASHIYNWHKPLKYSIRCIKDTAGPRWATTYGGKTATDVSSMHVTSDGGQIIGGILSGSKAGSEDFFIMRTDRGANVKWTYKYGGNKGDILASIQPASNGGYVAVGTSDSFGSKGDDDIWIVSLDSQGAIKWQMRYGTGNEDQAHHIQPTKDGGYVVTGSMHSTTSKDSAFLLKLNSSGSVKWQNAYRISGFETGIHAEQTSDSGYILLGQTISTGGDSDIWVLKMDARGIIKWQVALGGSEDDVGKVIRQTSDGGYILIGTTSSFGAGDSDILVMKLTSTGAIKWQNTFGSSGKDEGTCIQQTTDSGFIASGLTPSSTGDADVVILKLDKSGKVQWQKAYGETGNETSPFIDKTCDSGFAVACGMEMANSKPTTILAMNISESGDFDTACESFYRTSQLMTKKSTCRKVVTKAVKSDPKFKMNTATGKGTKMTFSSDSICASMQLWHECGE